MPLTMLGEPEAVRALWGGNLYVLRHRTSAPLVAHQVALGLVVCVLIHGCTVPSGEPDGPPPATEDVVEQDVEYAADAGLAADVTVGGDVTDAATPEPTCAGPRPSCCCSGDRLYTPPVCDKTLQWVCPEGGQPEFDCSYYCGGPCALPCADIIEDKGFGWDTTDGLEWADALVLPTDGTFTDAP